MAERFLVTGVLGCIGAWTAKLLLDEGVGVVGYDLGESTHRLELAGVGDGLTLVRGDVTDFAQLERTLDEHEITNVVHLAALQVPFCRADPVLGSRVNVVGTVNVFEAVRRRLDRIPRVVYTSSTAVYGTSDAGGADERPRPDTLYGVYKLANEGTARVYAAENGVPSVGLRPAYVYGPGRDQGMTSVPTMAMQAAARGEAFHIEFGGTAVYQYAPDVARAAIAASRADLDGSTVFNLGGTRAHMSEVVAAIEAAAPEMQGRITFDDVQLPILSEVESDEPIPLRWTPLSDGVRETIARFRA